MRSAALAILLAAALAGCGRPQAPAPSSAQPAALPAPVDGFVEASDGVPIAYRVTGQGEPTIVLVHGWSCDWSFWKAAIEDLSRDHRVVALDLPGHGASGKGREIWSVQGYGEDVATVVTALALERVVIVGHSMGGPVAVEAARRIPERIELVVGVDTFHDVTAKPDPAMWDKLVGDYRADFPGTCSAFVASMFPKDADPGIVAETRERMCDAVPEIAVPLFESFKDYDQAAALAALSCPLRLVQGSIYPTNLEADRKVHADVEAVVVPGTGHFPFLEKPQEFLTALRGVLVSKRRP
jgi:pimeloyl-ACP methyl ester carboxylesterase